MAVPSSKLCIIGGGLAGIACAAALADYHFDVSLFEARRQLGGRAGSFVDPKSGETIDHCQHVSMGCCTNLSKLCEQLGVTELFEEQDLLTFISPEGQFTTFQENLLPAPLHLSLAFLRLPYLSLVEKFSFARAVKKLAGTSSKKLNGTNFLNWLQDQGQTENLIRNCWEVVLISALSESLERIDAAYARKVFLDGFLANRKGWRVAIPKAPLDQIYHVRATRWFDERGVQVSLNSRLRELMVDGSRVRHASLSDGHIIEADEYVLAVPQYQAAELMEQIPALASLNEQLKEIETAPITSVHLALDRPITELKHAVLVERLSQWLFAKDHFSDQTLGEYRYQVVVSASRHLVEMPNQQVIVRVCEELRSIFSAMSEANVIDAKVVTDKRAVFSATPGIDDLRPSQQTDIENLYLAGDWTQTGWPATMEGAVRSGFLAAEKILQKHGINESPLAAELPVTWLSKRLLRIT